MADIEAARRPLADELESAGLPHTAGATIAGSSSFAQGAYITAVGAVTASPCVDCERSREAA